MIIRYIAAAMISSTFLTAVACASSEEPAGTSMRGPIRQLSTYEIQCHDDFYQIAIEEMRSVDMKKEVLLARLDRESNKIPQRLFDEVAQLFDEFRYISSLSFSCGLGDRYENSEELIPRKFLSVSVEGGHRESLQQAREECLAKGRNFDFATKRVLRIEGDTVEIIGDEIGYCYGEIKYFDLKFPTSEDESE